jgi:chaperone LolA
MSPIILVLAALLAAPAVAANYNQPAVVTPDKPAASQPVVRKYEAPKPIKAVEESDAKDIARVEKYLTSIARVVADFEQASADGSTGAGKLFIRRPGKMRWQYAPPTPILIVSDGKVVTYYDAGLDQVSYIGIDDTLAGFLARKVMTLDSPSTKLTHFEVKDKRIRATIVQKSKPAEGSLTLTFDDNPIRLRGMHVVDATGNATDVVLTNANYGPVLDNTLFTFEDPRGVNARRNKK